MTHAPHHLPSQSQYTFGCAWSWQSLMLGLTSSVEHKAKISLFLLELRRPLPSLQAHTVIAQAIILVLDFFLISAGRSAEFWNEWSEQVVSSDLQVLTIYLREKF